MIPILKMTGIVSRSDEWTKYKLLRITFDKEN